VGRASQHGQEDGIVQVHHCLHFLALKLDLSKMKKLTVAKPTFEGFLQ
jgi:hypothetical protein